MADKEYDFIADRQAKTDQQEKIRQASPDDLKKMGVQKNSMTYNAATAAQKYNAEMKKQIDEIEGR